MKVTGYITAVGSRAYNGKQYAYVDVEGLRISVPDSLRSDVDALLKGVEYTFIVQHSWVRTSSGSAFGRLQLLAIEGVSYG